MFIDPSQSGNYKAGMKRIDSKDVKKVAEQRNYQTRPSSTNNKQKAHNPILQAKNYLLKPRYSESSSLADKSYQSLSMYDDMKLHINTKLNNIQTKPSVYSFRSIALEPNPERYRCQTTYNSPSNKTLGDVDKNQMSRDLERRYKEMKGEVYDVYEKTEKKERLKVVERDCEEVGQMDRRTEKTQGMRRKNTVTVKEKPEEYSSIQTNSFKKPTKAQQKPLPYLNSQRNSLTAVESANQLKAQVEKQKQVEKKALSKEAQEDLEIKLLSAQEYMKQCDTQINELKNDSARKDKDIQSLRKQCQDEKTRNERNVQQMKHLEDKVKLVTVENEKLQQKTTIDKLYYERPLIQQIEKLTKYIKDLENKLSSEKLKTKRYEFCIDSNQVRTDEFQENQRRLNKTIEMLEKQLKVKEENFLKQNSDLKDKLDKIQKEIKLKNLDEESRLRLRKEVEEDLKNEVEECLRTKRENEELKEKLRIGEKEMIKLKSLQRGKTKDNKK